MWRFRWKEAWGRHVPGDSGSNDERRVAAGRQYRKSLRLALVMGVLSAISVLSHFVPLLGVPAGVFPWWMTIVTVLLFGFTVIVSRDAKAKRDETAKDEP